MVWAWQMRRWRRTSPPVALAQDEARCRRRFRCRGTAGGVTAIDIAGAAATEPVEHSGCWACCRRVLSVRRM